ncbi:hypothetical protein RhiirA4_541642 [Rhizophagus irregularis]|uniref:Uncharacterized protein n=1 Tax=Rhizophagus irregularis TaxID=588596 RepID=A0A2I1GC07_9GLOM|nr:hypothetical protein RhiirA4_541642 [Rhizophagus irregularis]
MIKEAIEKDDVVPSQRKYAKSESFKAFFFENGLVLIVWDINEFEINSYDDYHNLNGLFITLFDIIKQLTGKPIQVKHIHGNGWSCILGDLDMGQIHVMSIFKAESKAELNQIFSDIEKSDEDGVKEKRNQKNKEDKNSLKRKYGQSKIQSTDENIYEFESDNSRSKKVDIEEKRLRLELEIEDRKMNLKKRDIALRAEVEATEIANEKAKLALKNN